MGHYKTSARLYLLAVRDPNPRRRQRGIALVMVLWAVALLMVIGASFAFETRTEAMLSANLVDKVRADAAMEAGIVRAITALIQPRDLRWPDSRAVRPLRFGDAELRIAAISAHGRVDLNAAPDVLIEGVVAQALSQLGSENAPPPQEISDAILDWRDSDRVRRGAGAEDDDYHRLGRIHGAADRGFVSVSELLQVRGITPEVYARLASLFTVHTRSPRVDPGSAPREALLAIPGLTESAVDSFLEAREIREQDTIESGVSRLPVELLVAGRTYLFISRPTTYEILVEANLPGGVRSRSGAVVKVSRNRRKPYQVLARLVESDHVFKLLDD